MQKSCVLVNLAARAGCVRLLPTNRIVQRRLFASKEKNRQRGNGLHNASFCSSEELGEAGSGKIALQDSGVERH